MTARTLTYDRPDIATTEVRRTIKEVFAKIRTKININAIAFDTKGRLREMKQLRGHLYGIFDNIIEERINTNSIKLEGEVEEVGRKDFLLILLELKDKKDTPTTFNINLIKALLMDVVTAAIDTTSRMVEWVMAEMLHNPVVMRNVQDELTTVFGMNIVEESHLHKLAYLDAVIKETFRLHPLLGQT
ncbi:cytochrome P450 76C1-like protein [Tanacetum coccineum]